jgi:hypothetical protein
MRIKHPRCQRGVGHVSNLPATGQVASILALIHLRMFVPALALVGAFARAGPPIKPPWSSPSPDFPTSWFGANMHSYVTSCSCVFSMRGLLCSSVSSGCVLVVRGEHALACFAAYGLGVAVLAFVCKSSHGRSHSTALCSVMHPLHNSTIVTHARQG